MSPSWSLSFSAASALIAALAGVLMGAWLTARAQRSLWARGAGLEACAEVLRSFARLYQELGDACKNARPPERDHWTKWNQAIGVLALLMPAVVVDAALYLDSAMRTANQRIEQGTTGVNAWHELRQPLEPAQLAFMNAVRNVLVPGQSSLKHAYGRLELTHEAGS